MGDAVHDVDPLDALRGEPAEQRREPLDHSRWALVGEATGQERHAGGVGEGGADHGGFTVPERGEHRLPGGQHRPQVGHNEMDELVVGVVHRRFVQVAVTAERAASLTMLASSVLRAGP
jgi:hypothetical protein